MNVWHFLLTCILLCLTVQVLAVEKDTDKEEDDYVEEEDDSVLEGGDTEADDAEADDIDLDDHLNTISAFEETMDTVLEQVRDNVCAYECPNGAAPVPKKNHIPKSNGCGSFGIQMELTHIPGVVKCCDRHDICYDTCNKVKEDCDAEFKTCLMTMCDALQDFVSAEVYDGCKSASHIMYVGTMAVGCMPYKESQKEACVCPKKKKEEL